MASVILAYKARSAPGTGHWRPLVIGLAAGLVIAAALITGTWAGWRLTYWSYIFGLGPGGHLRHILPPVPPDQGEFIGPGFLVHGSLAAALLIVVAAAIAGWLIAGKAQLDGGLFVTALVLCLLGLAEPVVVTGFGVPGLASGNFALAWAQLNFNHVLIVLGLALLPTAVLPARWRAAGTVLSARPARLIAGVAGVAGGLIALPAVSYLIAIMSPPLTVTDHVWTPFGSGALYALEVVITAAVLAALTSYGRLPAVLPAVTGAPIFAIGLLMLLAPQPAVHVIAALIPVRDLRFEIVQLAATGQPLFYGGLFLAAAATTAFRRHRNRDQALSPASPPPAASRGPADDAAEP